MVDFRGDGQHSEPCARYLSATASPAADIREERWERPAFRPPGRLTAGCLFAPAVRALWVVPNIAVAEWFIVLDDDSMLFSEFDSSELYNSDTDKAVINGGSDGMQYAPPCTLSKYTTSYQGAIQKSFCLLNEAFGMRSYIFHDHYPVIASRTAAKNMTSKWDAEFKATQRSKYQVIGNVAWTAMLENYMVVTGKATHSGYAPSAAALELHTNSQAYCPLPCDGYSSDASDAVASKLAKFLERIAAGAQWSNIQGPGIDDANRYRHNPGWREYSPKLEGVVRPWLEKTFPVKSDFEL
jgi:hypothetical protein